MFSSFTFATNNPAAPNPPPTASAALFSPGPHLTSPFLSHSSAVSANDPTHSHADLSYKDSTDKGNAMGLTSRCSDGSGGEGGGKEQPRLGGVYGSFDNNFSAPTANVARPLLAPPGSSAFSFRSIMPQPAVTATSTSSSTSTKGNSNDSSDIAERGGTDKMTRAALPGTGVPESSSAPFVFAPHATVQATPSLAQSAFSGLWGNSVVASAKSREALPQSNPQTAPSSLSTTLPSVSSSSSSTPFPLQQKQHQQPFAVAPSTTGTTTTVSSFSKAVIAPATSSFSALLSQSAQHWASSAFSSDPNTNGKNDAGPNVSTRPVPALCVVEKASVSAITHDSHTHATPSSRSGVLGNHTPPFMDDGKPSDVSDDVVTIGTAVADTHAKSTGSVGPAHSAATTPHDTPPLYEHVTIPHHRSAAHWQPIVSPLFSPVLGQPHAHAMMNSPPHGQKDDSSSTTSGILPGAMERRRRSHDEANRHPTVVGPLVRNDGAVLTVAPDKAATSCQNDTTSGNTSYSNTTCDEAESEDTAEMARKMRRREDRFAVAPSAVMTAAHVPLHVPVRAKSSAPNTGSSAFSVSATSQNSSINNTNSTTDDCNSSASASRRPRDAAHASGPRLVQEDARATAASRTLDSMHHDTLVQASVPSSASSGTLSLLSRTWWSFMRKLTSGSARRDEAWLEAESAWFGSVGQTGLYPTLQQNTAEMMMLWRRLASSPSFVLNSQSRHVSSSSAPSGISLHATSHSMGSDAASTSSNTIAARWNGELWLVVFALATHINFIVGSVQTPTSQECPRVPDATRTTPMHINAASPAHSVMLPALSLARAAMRAHASDALTDACTLANHLSSLIVDLYQNDGDGVAVAPYALLPLLLRRVRVTFEVAGRCEGVLARVQSNAKATMSRLFALLHKRVKAVAVAPVASGTQQPGNSKNNSSNDYCPDTCGNTSKDHHNNNNLDDGAESEEVFVCHSTAQRQLLLAFAVLLAELVSAEAPMTAEMDRFMHRFARSFPHAQAERCTLYYCKATVMTQQSLTFELVRAACDLFTRAMIACPEDSGSADDGGDAMNYSGNGSATANTTEKDASHGSAFDLARVRNESNRRILFVKLTCCQLALGYAPHDARELHHYGAAQLLPMVQAVQQADLAVFTHAMHTHAAYYVETGVHNILHMVRQRIILLMVVKYYIAQGCQSRLSVMDLVKYYDLPYTHVEAMHIWLLPLLVKKYINGVLHNQSLILSQQKPFDDYERSDLLAHVAVGRASST